jgi:hypothetical protein
MLRIEGIAAWLTESLSTSNDGRYRHRRLVENPSLRGEVLDRLAEYTRMAHNDALQRLRTLAGISLDPLAGRTVPDPVNLYPHAFPPSVLQGFFGEVFAGILVEHFGPFGEDGWEIPAFLFRTHSVAFEQLEACWQSGVTARQIPGRTGDDCLAFRRDGDGRIIRTLYCEAKCTLDHNAALIADAHRKVSESPTVNILQLIEILTERGDADSLAWIPALRQLRLSQTPPGYERCDLVSYICGRAPVRGETWIGADAAHANYNATRRLEAVEMHMQGVESMVRAVYHSSNWI